MVDYLVDSCGPGKGGGGRNYIHRQDTGEHRRRLRGYSVPTT